MSEGDNETAVVDLRIHQMTVRLKAPFITAVRRAETADLVVVEAFDAMGRRGCGEAAVSWRVTGESPESVIAAVRGPLADTVVGRPAGDPSLAHDLVGSIWGNAAARSAVECAVAELAAAQVGQPLWAQLGATSATVRTGRTLSAAPPRELAETAARHVAEGFDVLKVKVRARDDVVAALREIRASVGEMVTLRVDANQAWRSDEAIRVIREVERAKLELEFVEQPVHASDLSGLAAVAAAVETPIMADESVRTAGDVHAIARRSSVALFNVKLAKTGGLTEARRVALAAGEHGRRVVVGCMLEGPVGITSAASFAASVAPATVHDLDGAHWLGESVEAQATATIDVDAIHLPPYEVLR